MKSMQEMTEDKRQQYFLARVLRFEVDDDDTYVHWYFIKIVEFVKGLLSDRNTSSELIHTFALEIFLLKLRTVHMRHDDKTLVERIRRDGRAALERTARSIPRSVRQATSNEEKVFAEKISAFIKGVAVENPTKTCAFCKEDYPASGLEEHKSVCAWHRFRTWPFPPPPESDQAEFLVTTYEAFVRRHLRLDGEDPIKTFGFAVKLLIFKITADPEEEVLRKGGKSLALEAGKFFAKRFGGRRIDVEVNRALKETFECWGRGDECDRCLKFTKTMSCTCLRRQYCGERCWDADWPTHRHDCADAQCDECGRRVTDPVEWCSVCLSVKYCGKVCQMKAWEREHEAACRSAVAAAELSLEAAEAAR